MNVIQNSSKFVVSCVTNTQRDKSDWSYGEADYEELEPLFQSSHIKSYFCFISNSSLPPTTSLIIEQQVLGISEKSDVSDSVSEILGLRGISSE